MSEKISCAECGKQMSCVNNKHLASHGMTADQYREKFHGALLRTQEVADRLSKRSIESNKDRVGKPRSKEDLEAIRAGVSKRPSRKGIALGAPTDEHKKKISETKKRMYAEGLITPPTLGKNLSQTVKNKISNTLIQINGRRSRSTRRPRPSWLRARTCAASPRANPISTRRSTSRTPARPRSRRARRSMSRRRALKSFARPLPSHMQQTTD